MSKDLETYTMTLQEERDYYCKCMRGLQDKIDKAIKYIKNDYDEENDYSVPKRRLLEILGEKE